MNKLCNFLFFLIFSLSFSQKYVTASITKMDNDTINSKMKITTNMFSKNFINENSFIRTLYLIDDNGDKTRNISAKDIKDLKFIDLDGKPRTYVNDGKLLRELLFNGKKIKYYRGISQNLYDGSIQSNYYLIDSNGKKYSLRKKDLIEITKSKPELLSEIENRSDVESIINILKKYEED